MSSFPGATPSTLPPIAPNHYMERTNQPTPQPERRSTSPRDVNRRSFSRIRGFIERYSIPVSQMSSGDVRKFLTAETKELKHLDPLIKLATLVQSGRVNPQIEDVHIGSYRFVSPSIKQLNDVYLGQNQTDDLIFNDLSDSVKNNFTHLPDDVLSANFKGGLFVLKFNELTNGSGRTHEEVLEAKIVEMHEKARELLLKHLQDRSDMLERRRIELSDRIEEEASDEDAVSNIYAQIKRIDQNLEALRNLITDIETGKEKIDLAFGFDRVQTEDNDLQDLFMAIRNAECAANMAIVDTKENGHRRPKMYSHEEFLVEAIHTLQLLGEFGIIDENGSVKDEWKPFFYADAQGYLRMQPDMIKIYRRLDKYRTSSDYQGMSESQKRDFESKIRKFGQYYTRINIVDVLKRFQEENIQEYVERVQRITDLIHAAEEELNPHRYHFSDLPVMRKLLEQISHELEISLKDEGEEVISTTRALIKELLKEGEKVIVFTDNIGFGATNQASYEKSVIDIVNLLNINDEEWDQMNGSRSKLEEVVARKYQGIANDPSYRRAILQIGDHGSQLLRENERKAQEIFGGKGTVDSEMGDETKILYHADENPDIPADSEAIKRKLLGFSMETKMRIAAVSTDFHITPLVDPIERMIIHEQSREEILRLIEFINWAADAHDKIKDLNALGYHKVEVLQDQAE